MTRAAVLPPAARDELLSDAMLDADELALRVRIREVVDRHVAPRAAEIDRDRTFAHESYQALARAGLAGLLFPPELGGSGHSTVAYATAMEEIAAACGATSLIYMTQMHTAYPIHLAGTEVQRRRYIPGLCNGERYGSLAITEPDAGSDVAALRTAARRDGDHYVLDGTKTFITTGDRSDVIICFTTVDRMAGRDGLTAFIVEGDNPGLSRGRTLRKMGMHASTTAELFLNGAWVPAAARLGPEGGAWALVMRSVVKSRISAAAQGLGLARGAYTRALSAVAGPEIGEEVEFELASLRARLVEARLLLLATARAVDRDDTLTAEVSMAKLRCTDLALDVALTAAELLGAAGDLAEFEVERYVRDAKVTQIYDGTNEVQRLIIARDTRRRLRGWGE
ncbi:MAG: acyl-CoA dehydrogenase [Streptosporangiales bacterium]|nr:acyl-CoA dehydrogenase [Streptosporangiales bacterium]